jgi:hypothetical protein
MTRRRHCCTIAAVAALGCSDGAGSASALELGVTANDDAGHGGPVACLVLPVLPGSRVLTRYVVDDSFDVILDAAPNAVSVRFEGSAGELERTRVITRRQLSQGYSEQVELTPEALARYTTRYTITLSSECVDE